MTKQKKGINLSKEDSLKILTCLEFAVYKSEELTKENKHLLYHCNEDLVWFIADKFGFDMNSGYIDIETLEYIKFN